MGVSLPYRSLPGIRVAAAEARRTGPHHAVGAGGRMTELKVAKTRAAHDSLLLWDHIAGVFTSGLRTLISIALLVLAALVALLEWIYRHAEPEAERPQSPIQVHISGFIRPRIFNFSKESHHASKSEARS
jgi:hypothetical protein